MVKVKVLKVTKKILIGYNATPYLKRPGRALSYFKAGIKWRIPLCCIIQFSIDCLVGRAPGVWRGEKHHKYGVFVPCSFHKDKDYKMPQRYIMKDGQLSVMMEVPITIRRAPVV